MLVTATSYDKDRDDLMVTKGNQLHLIQLILVGVYGAVFGTMNIFLHNESQSWLNFSLVPLSLIAGGLYRYQFQLASKLMNVLQTNAVLALLALQTGPSTFIGAFYLPVIIGSLIIFSGKQSVYSYCSVALSLALLAFLLLTDVRIGNLPPFTPEALKTEWMMNLIGAALLVVVQVSYLLAINNLIQKKIMLQTVILNRQNDDLQQSLHTRDVFLSVVSHDLRSPLLLLKAGLSVFDPEKLNPGMQLVLKRKFENRLENTISMAESVLLWAQTQQNRIQYHESLHHLKEVTALLQNLTELFRGEYDLHYEIQFPEEDIQFYCDLQMLQLVFRNLISNASKFTTDHERVAIICSHERDKICFHVKDSGKGMDQEMVQRLLQGKSHTTQGLKVEKGFGVGLELVRHFLRLHGSELKIESAPGKGSDFFFCLRKVPVSGQQQKQAYAPAEHRSAVS